MVFCFDLDAVAFEEVDGTGRSSGISIEVVEI